MTSSLPTPEVESTITLPPLASINHALGANHDMVTGLDELIDNAIDGGATEVAIVFHSGDVLLESIAVHDNGSGMSQAKMEEVLRLGGHAAHSEKNIGRYGMGLKEGSFANGDTAVIVSKRSDGVGAGFRLSKATFDADRLSQRSVDDFWRLRTHINFESGNGTSVVWTDLTHTYKGADAAEAAAFLGSLMERVRKHIGIRYHRFLGDWRINIDLFDAYPGIAPTKSATPLPINPLGYTRSGHSKYPRELTYLGVPGAHGVTAHVWNYRSKKEEFILEEKDVNGHQGFYVYDADRLITAGGWFTIRSQAKELQLLRIEISDPRVIEEFVTISPQKGSVIFKEGFHSFLRELRDPDDPTVDIEQVYLDAAAVVKNGNQRSGKASPLAEPGKGIASAIRRSIEDNAVLKPGEPINVVWHKMRTDDFVSIDPRKRTVYLNDAYRKYFNDGRNRRNDAPLIRTLLYLLFNEQLSSSRFTQTAQSNSNLWITVINAAAREMVVQLDGGETS